MVHEPVANNCLLDDSKAKRICEAIEAGSSFRYAAQSVGVSPQTARKWRDQGQLDDAMGADSAYRNFFLAVQLAEGALERRLTDRWVKALEEDEDGWKGIQAFLEKRYKDEWGKAPVELQAQILDLKKTPEFHELIKLISQIVPPEKQEELSLELGKLIPEKGKDGSSG